MFVLRPDGLWVDFNAYARQGKPEAMDEIVFSTITQVMETFGRLCGRPQVLDLPIDEAGLKAWIERQKGGNPLEAAREWAVGYKERRRKQTEEIILVNTITRANGGIVHLVEPNIDHCDQTRTHPWLTNPQPQPMSKKSKPNGR